MVPGAVVAQVAEEWLRSFAVREEAFVLLGAATDTPPDTWRKRLSYATYKNRTGTLGNHGWYGQESVADEKVDEFLSAAGLTHLWHVEPLVEYAPQYQMSEEDFAATCADCGTWIDWRQKGAGVTVEIGQMVNVRRSWRWFSLCPRCASFRLPLAEPAKDVVGRRNRKIPNDAAHKLYLEYLSGIGLKMMCERHYARFGYANANSMVTSLIQLWGRAGWPMRGRAASKTLNREKGHRRSASRFTDEALRKCYELHMRRDLSLNDLGKAMFEKMGYKNHHSCAVAIAHGWKRLGLKARDRIEMTRVKSTKNGLSPRNWKDRKKLRLEAGLTLKGKERRICVGTTMHRSRKGERCERPAMKGSVYCQSHAPELSEQRKTLTARMRANSPLVKNTVPVGLILPDLLRFKQRYGRYRVLEELTGFSEAMLYRQAKRAPDERMMNDTYLRLRAALDQLLPVELPAAA